MTIFATNAVVVQRFAIGLYNTVVGATTMGQVNNQINNTDLNSTLNSYYTSSFGATPTATVASTLVTNLGITGASSIATAQAYIVSVLNAAAPAARGEAVKNIISLFSGLTADATFGAAATSFNKKVLAADGYAGATNIAAAEVLTPTTQNLTAGVDTLTGTAGDDTFVAEAVGGALQTSDRISGGLGNDTLSAIMVAQSHSVSPIVTGVEKFVITAQAGANADGTQNNINNTPTAVKLDFGRIVGELAVESNNSRADLLVEDVRLEQDKITKDFTITMRDTDPGLVDFGVYFDQLSLRNVSSSTSLINLRVLDTNATNLGLAPLKDSPYGSFKFSYSIAGGPLQVATLASAGIQNAQTFAEMVTALQAAANTVFGAGVVTVTTGSTYTVVDPVSGRNVQGTELVLSAAGSIRFDTTPAGSGWLATETVPAISGLYTSFNTDVKASTALVTSTIVLDNVGRGSNSGDLVVGGLSAGNTSPSLGVQRFDITVEDDSKLSSIMSTNNTLREVYLVNGATDRHQNAYNPYAAGAGNLKVRENTGNLTEQDQLPGSSGQGDDGGGKDYGFTDVRVVDGSAFKGILNMSVGVTATSVTKYLNRTDTANDPTADNVQFSYMGGAGNDIIDLDIASAAAASSGRLSSHEDAKFTVDGGAGNDTLTVMLDSATSGSNEHISQKTFDNITINGGDGNDTINAPGIADMVINAGAGNDTVYSDNSALIATDNAGDRNVWLVSTAASTLPNLAGAIHANNSQFLFGATVRVTYASQIGVTGGVTNAAAAALTNGFESAATAIPTGTNNAMTQYHLNQAIKKAINEDATLSKLLLAQDGPNNALRITSLMDGTNVTTGLIINVAATVPAGASADEAAMLSAYRAFLGDSNQTAAQANAAVAATVADLVARPGMVAVAAGGTEIFGTNSANDRDNIIDLGAGDDVLVLSSSTTANEVIRIVGDDIGKDTLVNFAADTAANGGDRLNFNAHLTGTATATNAANVATAGNTIANNILITLGTQNADSVNIINGKAFTATQTFAGLNAANFLAAVNTTGNAAYAAIVDGDAVSKNAANAFATGTLVGTTYNSIYMVENGGNLGEYKVFKMTSTVTNAVVADFTGAVLLGTLDFGNTLGAGFTVANSLVA